MFDHVRTFYQPGSVAEAVRLLNQKGEHTVLVAGGTDLVLRAGRSVTALVDISHLGLSFIKRDTRSLRIGATTTLSELVEARAAQHLADGILVQAASACGSVQTRNVATVGGNLANASPAADLAVPLLALDSQLMLQGLRTRRKVPITEFFSGPHETVARAALLTEIIVPLPPPGAWSFVRLARTETDIAVVSAAVGLQLDRERRCLGAKIALGAVAPQPMRAVNAESVFPGKILTREVIENAAEIAMAESQPISDLRASADYRRDMVRVLVRRALYDCARRLEVEL